MKTLCIISMPRCGTNHLCAMLGNFDRIRSAGELFHPSNAFGVRPSDLDHMRQQGLDFADRSDPRLIAFAKGHPRALIDHIEQSPDCSDKDCFTFKVFDYQLPWELVTGEILSMPDLSVAFVSRRILDTFISSQKGAKAGAWHSNSTTDIQVALDVEEYAEWRQRTRLWLDTMFEEVTGRRIPYFRVSYEDDIDRPVAAFMDVLSQRLGKVGLPTKYEMKKDGYQKQDQAASYREKVSNWDAFSEAACDRGLDLDETSFAGPAPTGWRRWLGVARGA